MSIISRTRPQVKPTRKTDRPARPFGEGILPVRATPTDLRTLPTIEGAGLTPDELARVNAARNLARSIYAADCPEATPGELDAVAERAAGDALRSVLRDRPAAPELLVPCCSHGEPEPCLVCVASTELSDEERAILAELDATNPEGAAEVDLSTFPAFTAFPAWTDDFHWTPTAPPAPLLTLAELIDQEAARLRRMETAAGDLMGGTLAELARTVRFVQARTPGDFEARMEVLGRDDDRLRPEPELMPSGRWA